MEPQGSVPQQPRDPHRLDYFEPDTRILDAPAEFRRIPQTLVQPLRYSEENAALGFQPMSGLYTHPYEQQVYRKVQRQIQSQTVPLIAKRIAC